MSMPKSFSCAHELAPSAQHAGGTRRCAQRCRAVCGRGACRGALARRWLVGGGAGVTQPERRKDTEGTRLL
jgi:hypothetical protein